MLGVEGGAGLFGVSVAYEAAAYLERALVLGNRKISRNKAALALYLHQIEVVCRSRAAVGRGVKLVKSEKLYVALVAIRHHLIPVSLKVGRYLAAHGYLLKPRDGAALEGKISRLGC